MENKRSDINIYVYGYHETNYELPENSLYTPVQCGLAYGDKQWLSNGDNTGDNISDMNHFYAECSGTYWVWKNHPSSLKYIGQCQYRRWLLFDENLDFDYIFNKADVILPEPYQFRCTVRDHYRNCHNINDLILIGDIVKEKYPEYHNAFEAVLNGNIFYYSAGFVTRTEDFHKYCEFLFGVLGEFRNRLNLNTMKDVEDHVREGIDKGYYKNNAKLDFGYQSLIGGFMAERLLSAFVITNFKKQMIMRYILK